MISLCVSHTAREAIMKKVLVTGATGFIALHCIEQLLRDGYAVRSTVRTPSRISEVKDAIAAQGLDADAVDVAVVPGGDAALVVGVQRPLLQAWINVIEVADLPLRRVEWSMAAALPCARSRVYCTSRREMHQTAQR